MKKNTFYLISAILNFVGAFSSLIGTIVMLVMGTGFMDIITESFADLDPEYSIGTEFAELYAGLYYVMLFVMLISILISVWAGIKMLKFSNTNEKSNSVILWIVLCFLFCGTISGILGIVGYVNGGTLNSAAPTKKDNAIDDIPVVKADNYSCINKLKDLQKLREDNVISEQEYDRMRVKILEGLDEDKK